MAAARTETGKGNVQSEVDSRLGVFWDYLRAKGGSETFRIEAGYGEALEQSSYTRRFGSCHG